MEQKLQERVLGTGIDLYPGSTFIYKQGVSSLDWTTSGTTNNAKIEPTYLKFITKSIGTSYIYSTNTIDLSNYTNIGFYARQSSTGTLSDIKIAFGTSQKGTNLGSISLASLDLWNIEIPLNARTTDVYITFVLSVANGNARHILIDGVVVY